MPVAELLTPFYANTGPERVGFILHDDSVVEVENIHPEPEEGASIRAADLFAYEHRAKAFWHTHPNSSCNLTTPDLRSFLGYPLHIHYVVGRDGVAGFAVLNGEVVRCE